MRPAFAVAAFAAASLTYASPALATPTWFGDILGFTYYYPDINTAYQREQTLSTGGTLTNVGYNGNYNGYTGVSFTLEATQIVINMSSAGNPSLTWGSGVAFNGWVLDDLTNDPLITDVTIGSETDFAMPQSDISFTSDSISVNWAGVEFGEASQLVLNVEFDPPAAVPEPGSLALFGTALAGFGFLRRKLRRTI